MAAAAPYVGAASALAGTGVAIEGAVNKPKLPKPQQPLEDPNIAAQKMQEQRRRQQRQRGRASTIYAGGQTLGGGGGARGGSAKQTLGG